jgi:hypothetical protein
VDGKWLKAPAGLLREDNSEKPSFIELEKKIKGEWMTEANLVTDASGGLMFEGFRGEYEIESNDKKTAFTLSKESAQQVQQISLP